MMAAPRMDAPGNGTPSPVSEKEQLAKLIKNYIVHAEQIALHSNKPHYHNTGWAMHMDSVLMLKSICKNIRNHTMSELKLFAFNAIKHLEHLLPALTNPSYLTSKNNLDEIKRKLYAK
jgi:hypothetical protein